MEVIPKEFYESTDSRQMSVGWGVSAALYTNQKPIDWAPVDQDLFEQPTVNMFERL